MDWRIKAAAFRVLGAVPFGADAHFWLQRHITRTWPRSASDLAALLGWARYLIGAFSAIDPKPIDQCAFAEIGAGRDLAVPVALRLLGVGRVYTVDINRIAQLDLVNHVASTFSELLSRPPVHFKSWDDLAAFGVEYRAPSNVSEVPDGIDCFFSNEVLEHIPVDSIRQCLRDAARRLKPDGLAIHAIDYSDHYARGSGVSRYNFLKYSDAAWKPFNSDFQYVNRLRHSEYLRLFEDSGFEIVSQETHGDGLPSELVPQLADKFASFDRKDLGILRSRIVARVRSRSNGQSAS